MFQPASLKGDSPTPLDERIRKRFMVLYITIILLSFIPCSLFEYFYITYFWNQERIWQFFILLPFNIVILIYILQFSAILFSLLFLTVIKILHPPKEGIFKRNIKDRDYLFWNIRNIIKKWPLYIIATNPLPWFKNRFSLRFFGTKIGKKCICDNGWISSEFVSIGKNVIIGMGTTILSFAIEQDKFILKKITIKDDVLIGAKCVLMPGTIIKQGAKLSAHSYTDHNSILQKGLPYKGHPAKQLKTE